MKQTISTLHYIVYHSFNKRTVILINHFLSIKQMVCSLLCSL